MDMNYKDIISEVKKQAVNSVISEDIVMELSDNNNLSNMDFSLLCEELEHNNITIASDEEYKKELTNKKIVIDKEKHDKDDSHSNDEIVAITDLFLKLSDEDKKDCLIKLSTLIEQNSSNQLPADHQELDYHAVNNIKKEFITMLSTKSLQYSYIAVLIKALMANVNSKGQAPLEDLIDYFRDFYDDRRKKGNVVEQKDSVFYKGNYTRTDIRKIILFNPIKRSFIANYVTFNKSTNMLSINSSLWTILTQAEKQLINDIADEKLKAYYDRISGSIYNNSQEIRK